MIDLIYGGIVGYFLPKVGRASPIATLCACTSSSLCSLPHPNRVTYPVVTVLTWYVNDSGATFQIVPVRVLDIVRSM